jgi:phenylpropionate dioxygenase-like ring-hydroxylating dioxygenase large terminal subunit
MMENSFDNSHFSFVHKGNFGLFDNPKPSKYEFRPNEWGFEAETHVPVRNPEASYRITGTTEEVTERHLINRWYMPFARRFGCVYPASGIHHIIYNCATLVALFPIISNTALGLRSVNAGLINLFKINRAMRWRFFCLCGACLSACLFACLPAGLAFP